jgi:hypothetical protein
MFLTDVACHDPLRNRERSCTCSKLHGIEGSAVMGKVSFFIVLTLAGFASAPVSAQAWRNCVQGSIAPGGCESIAPGGGLSIAPGGGQSIAPGGGLSIAAGGGQSIAPGGGLSIAPGGGLGPDRDWSRGLDTRTMRDPGNINSGIQVDEDSDDN